MKKLLLIAVVLAAAAAIFMERAVVTGPGVSAPVVPLQKPVRQHRTVIYREFRITPLAQFHIRAKVLSKENYYFGRESELSPVDLALGWGRMSDESVLKSIGHL